MRSLILYYKLLLIVTISFNFIYCEVLKPINKKVEIVKIKDDLSSEEELDKIIKSITEKNKRCKTSLLSGLCKHEVSSSNLIKANDIIEKLKK